MLLDNTPNLLSKKKQEENTSRNFNVKLLFVWINETKIARKFWIFEWPKISLWCCHFFGIICFCCKGAEKKWKPFFFLGDQSVRQEKQIGQSLFYRVVSIKIKNGILVCFFFLNTKKYEVASIPPRRILRPKFACFVFIFPQKKVKTSFTNRTRTRKKCFLLTSKNTKRQIENSC
jgi:hypothetical protein